VKTLTKTEEEETIIINRPDRSTYPEEKSVSEAEPLLMSNHDHRDCDVLTDARGFERLRTWAARRRRCPPAPRPGDPRGTAGGRFPRPGIEPFPGAESPRIHSDGSRDLRAPRARRQEYPGAGGDGLGKGLSRWTKGRRRDLERDHPSPRPGFHYYWFVLDGVDVNDPTSLTYFATARRRAASDPGAGGGLYAMKNVAHDG